MLTTAFEAARALNLDLGKGRPVDEETPALDEVINCETHDAYNVEHVLYEDIDWSVRIAVDADGALQAFIAGEDPDILTLLQFTRGDDWPNQVEFVGRFADGTIHGVVTVSANQDLTKWAVSHSAVCTLEEVPDAPEEDEDDDVLEDADLFED